MLVVALTVGGGFVRFIDIGSFPGPLQWSVAIRVIHICHVNSESDKDSFYSFRVYYSTMFNMISLASISFPLNALNFDHL
jgi:hypothetical protein